MTLAHRRWALVSGVLLLGVLLGIALLAGLFGSPTHQDFTNGLTPDGYPVGASLRFPLGTDTLGRNQLARLAYGSRSSLLVAVVASATSLAFGTAVGVCAGFYRGPFEAVAMRFTDVALSVPSVLAAFALAALLPAGTTRVIVIITVLFWAYPARLVYGEVTRLRSRSFVEAAVAAGGRGTTIVTRHVVPHVLPLAITYAPLNAAAAILFEATLSYLGAGITPPTPSWGNMIADGQLALGYAPHILIEPALFLAVSVLSFLLIGEGLKSRERGVSRASWLVI